MNDDDGDQVLLSEELKNAIKGFVAHISKSFIVDWYRIVSETNHDFVVSLEALIEEILIKLAKLCMQKLDKYRTGLIITDLLHEHVLSQNVEDKINSIKNQINEHEYDICQNFVVHLYGLLCNTKFRNVILTEKLTSDILDNYYDDDSFEGSRPSPSASLERFSSNRRNNGTSETSALYTLVIALLIKSVFMPIIETICAPKWLYAVIIWICDKEESTMNDLKKTNVNTKQPSDNERKKSGTDSLTSSRRSSAIPIQEGTGRLIEPLVPTIAINNTHSLRTSRSLDLEEGFDIVAPSINFENPVCDSLKRPLDNIEIYSTEEVQSHNSCYILYCIRYDGLCHRHPSAGANVVFDNINSINLIDKRGSTINSTENQRLASARPSASSSSTSRKSFRRTMTIKRRFREFVILQLRLEENPKIRPYMKNIPKPTKLKAATQNIFSLPGITNIKLDQSTIRLRQRFLERFLTALNNSPFIANSYEFKEFFSCNVNSNGINNISKSSILSKHLKNVISESARSAVNIFKSTLSGDHLHKIQPDPDEWLTELQQSTLKLHVQTRASHQKMHLEKLIDIKLINMSEKYSEIYSNYRYNYASFIAKKANLAQQQIARQDQPNRRKTSTTSSHQLRQSNSASSIATNDLKITNNNNNSPTNYPKVDNVKTVIIEGSNSTESVYYDAPSDTTATNSNINSNSNEQQNNNEQSNQQLAVGQQVLDSNSLLIAKKIIDIVHYSITRDLDCSGSTTNVLARLLVGSMIERYAVSMIETCFNASNAAVCVEGITSAIWEEGDGPPLDVENATLELAIKKLSQHIETKYASHTFIPQRFIHSIVVRQLEFHLSQLESIERNKFVIYSFLNNLIGELQQ